MKNRAFMALLVATFLRASETEHVEKLAVHITNQNHNNHKISVHAEKQDQHDCLHYCGDELKMRMADLPKEELSKNLIKFSDNKRINYVHSLTGSEAQQVLNTLDAEERTVLKNALGDKAEKIIAILEKIVEIDNSFTMALFRIVGLRRVGKCS